MSELKPQWFTIYRQISLASAAVVTLAMIMVFVFAVGEYCAALDFTSVDCPNPTINFLASVAITISWATFYTGVPAILALSGAYFVAEWLLKLEKERGQ